MSGFDYRQGVLHCDDVSIPELVKEYGTPLYVYSAHTFRDRYNEIASSFGDLNPIICYSVKSCWNLHILKMLHELGASFDVVSGGELARALDVGADPKAIVYAGVGKTDLEIEKALEAGIGWFNVESVEELKNIASIAERKGKVAHAALRVNPDVDPKTHDYTTTGKSGTKFGVDIERARQVFEQFAGCSSIAMSALHLHIGSPVNTVEPYIEAIRRALELIDELNGRGHRIDTLDIGGGFGTDYVDGESATLTEYGKAITPLLKDRGLRVILEPGRCISANAGILVGSVLYTKPAGDKRYAILDASMTDLIRPALYEAWHFTWPVAPGERFVPPGRDKQVDLSGLEQVDLVGPVCESGDFLAKERMLPPLKRGDQVAVFSAGAYGMVMSCQYNTRCRPAEILVEGATTRLIRRRETWEDIVGPERV